ncbi:MAG: hypothetical protein ACRDRR_21720 [Pseudonocardiaceae bacterium]
MTLKLFSFRALLRPLSLPDDFVGMVEHYGMSLNGWLGTRGENF